MTSLWLSWISALACALLLFVVHAAAHTCIHDDLLADHDKYFWDRKIFGWKNASNPQQPQRRGTRRELHHLPGWEGTRLLGSSRPLDTSAQYLARPWRPIRIKVDFVDIGTDVEMDHAKKEFLQDNVIPAAVAKLEAALEVRSYSPQHVHAQSYRVSRDRHASSNF